MNVAIFSDLEIHSIENRIAPSLSSTKIRSLLMPGYHSICPTQTHQIGILTLFWHCAVVHSPRFVWLFATPWTAAHQASLSFTISQSLIKLSSIESLIPSNHLILYHPLLLLPSILPSVRVFSKESAFCIRGQSIGASASASVLPMDIQDWFPLGWTGSISLLTQGLSSSPTPQFKSMSSSAFSLLYGPTHIHTWLLEKPQLYMDLGLQTNVSAF